MCVCDNGHSVLCVHTSSFDGLEKLSDRCEGESSKKVTIIISKTVFLYQQNVVCKGGKSWGDFLQGHIKPL